MHLREMLYTTDKPWYNPKWFSPAVSLLSAT